MNDFINRIFNIIELMPVAIHLYNICYGGFVT